MITVPQMFLLRCEFEKLYYIDGYVSVFINRAYTIVSTTDRLFLGYRSDNVIVTLQAILPSGRTLALTCKYL